MSAPERPPACPVAPTTDFDHHAPLDESELWPLYEHLRAEGPIHRAAGYGGYWVVSGFEEVKAVLRDHDSFTTAQGAHIPSVGTERRIPHETHPPAHTDYRAIVMQPVSGKRVRAVQPVLDEIVDRLLDRFVAAGGGDFVAEVAEPMPLQSLAVVIGFSEETATALREAMAAALDRMSSHPVSQIYSEMAALCATEVARHRAERPADFITTLLDARVDDRLLTDDEIVQLLRTFAAAGHHTTIAAAASLVHLLGTDLALQQRIRRDPDLIGEVVEELLRLRPPGHTVARTALRDVEIGGVRIAAGEKVLLAVAAANRQPDAFACPAEFDTDRGGRGHLTFGWGIHQCAGAALARAELRTLLRRLCARPPFRVTDADLGVLTGGTHYGPVSVHVVFE